MIQVLKDKNLLFLEDNDDFIANAVDLFRIFFSEIYTAKTIAQAKRLLSQEKVDIILSDIHLRSENALDFIEEVRKENTSIPIVVLSGYKDEALLFRAIPLGLSAYLLKPLDYASLNRAFESCAKLFVSGAQNIVTLKDGFTYGTQRKVVQREGVVYELNKKEILFFEMLVENKNRILTKEMFERFVYENNEMSDSALINFVMRIRKRFGKEFLHTVADIGYKMVL